MAGETDDADAAADRLEAALERLAALAGTPRSASVVDNPPADSTANFAAAEEIAARLDGLIDRLRAALGGRAPDNSRTKG
ncbi:MAG TPA: hypothetical protein VGG99_27070 [Acetobacteraceae bacterium]|jgi:hypothetical protein